MNYLDITRLPSFVKRHFGPHDKKRLVGLERECDSGYFDICRFFGDGPLNPAEVHISYLKDEFVLSDPTIARFAGEMAERMRYEGRLYPGPPVMKLAGFMKSASPATMIVQPTSYERFAGSCLALDAVHPLFERYGGTLRDYYKTNYPGSAVDKNPLAICLGVCGLMVVSDGGEHRLLVAKRASHLTSLVGTFGPSAAGIVDFNTDYRSLEELTVGQMRAEVAEETGLEAGEFDIEPLAYAREIFRGEHPQIFCLITTNLRSDEIERRLACLSGRRREFDEYRFLPWKSDSAVLSELNFEALMNYHLLQEWQSFQR
jgi:hypothetical protein